VECNVEEGTSVKNCATQLGNVFPKLDMLLHGVAFAPKEALRGDPNKPGNRPFANCSRSAFLDTFSTSTYSLLLLTQHFTTLMEQAAQTCSNSTSSVMALSFDGSERVVPGYGVMGPAKGALEASSRYLAVELGELGIRVNCISAGPINTLAARGIPNFGQLKKSADNRQPLKREVGAKEVADVAVFLASNLSRGITGQTILVDGGQSVVR